MCYKESTQLKPGVVDIPIISSFKRQSTRLDQTTQQKEKEKDMIRETKKKQEN